MLTFPGIYKWKDWIISGVSYKASLYENVPFFSEKQALLGG